MWPPFFGLHTGPWRHQSHIKRPDTRPMKRCAEESQKIPLQTWGHPHTLDPLEAHKPPCLAQQGGHPAIAVATVLSGECNDILGQRGFVICPARHLALRRSMLPENTADPPL